MTRETCTLRIWRDIAQAYFVLKLPAPTLGDVMAWIDREMKEGVR